MPQKLRVQLVPVSPAEKARLRAARGETGPTGPIEAKEKLEAERYAKSLQIGPLAEYAPRALNTAGAGFVSGVGTALSGIAGIADKVARDKEPGIMASAVGGGYGPIEEQGRESIAKGAEKLRDAAQFSANTINDEASKLRAKGVDSESLGGKIIEGIGSAGSTLPRIMVWGPPGLVIDSAMMAYAHSNPEGSTDIAGVQVPNELVDTVVGAVKGLAMHYGLKVAGQLPPGLAQVGGGTVLGAATALEKGATLKDVVSSFVVGAGLSPKGVKDQTVPGFVKGVQQMLPGPLKPSPVTLPPTLPELPKAPVEMAEPGMVPRPPEAPPRPDAPKLPTQDQVPDFVARNPKLKFASDIRQYEETVLATAKKPADAVKAIENTKANMDILGVKDSEGNVTPHFATRVYTVLDNIIAKFEGSPDRQAQDYVKIAKLLKSMPHTDLPINMAPGMMDVDAVKAFGQYSATTGRITMDPGWVTNNPLGVAKIALHEIGHAATEVGARTLTTENSTVSPLLTQGREKITGIGDVLGDIVKGSKAKQQVADLAYGGKNPAEYATTAAERADHYELFKFVLGEKDAAKVADLLQGKALDVMGTPRPAGWQNMPVNVSLRPTDKPGEYWVWTETAEKAKGDRTLVRKVGKITLKPGEDVGAKEAELGTQLMPTMLAATPDMAVFELLKMAHRGMERLRTLGVDPEKGGAYALSKTYEDAKKSDESKPLWRGDEEPRGNKTMYPEDSQDSEDMARAKKPKAEETILKINDKPDPNGWDYFAKQSPTGRTYWRVRPGAPVETAVELTGLKKGAKEFYDRKIDGVLKTQGIKRFSQPALPPAEDQEIYLGVRTHDGTIFTNYKLDRDLFVHPEVADYYKLLPEDVKDAGYVENGRYTPKFQSSIKVWRDNYYFPEPQGADIPEQFGNTKAQKGPDGKYIQPELPKDGMSIPAIRAKDGTIFYVGEDAGDRLGGWSKYELISKVGINPSDVQDIGELDWGKYTPQSSAEPTAKGRVGGLSLEERQAKDTSEMTKASRMAKWRREKKRQEVADQFAREMAAAHKRTVPAEEPVGIELSDGRIVSNPMMYGDMMSSYIKGLGYDPKDIKRVGVMRDGKLFEWKPEMMSKATRRALGYYRLFEPYTFPQKTRFVQEKPEGAKVWRFRGDNWVIDPNAPEPEWFKGENYKQWIKDMEAQDYPEPAWSKGGEDVELPKDYAKRFKTSLPDMDLDRNMDVSNIAKAERDKEGRWLQPRLPGPEDSRSHLTIRMKDGTLFVDTKDEFAIHQQLAEALGVPAREVRDAGFFQNGDFRMAPYSMIAEWKAWQRDMEDHEAAAQSDAERKAAEAMTPQQRLMEVGRAAARGYEETDLLKNVEGRVETASQQLARRRREFDIVQEAARDEDLRLKRIIYSPKKGEIERAGFEGKTALSMKFDPEVDYRDEYADLLSRVGEEESRTYKPSDVNDMSKATVKKREEAVPMPTKPAVMARFAGTFKSAEDIIKAVGGKGRFQVRLGFDPETIPASKVNAKLLEKVGLVKQSPEYTALFDEVYKNSKDIPWNQVVEFKTEKSSYKLADMMVVKLTNNCQRANALSFYKEFGLAPSDWSIKPCYGFACWADRKAAALQFNLRAKGYQSIAERGYQEASPESIRKVWQSPAFLRDAQKTPFFRHGQTGDDSHSIHRGMAYEWLKAQQEAGPPYNKIKNVFISAGYAPTTPADYARLLPYKDNFIIHFSVSGWDGFPKGETLNRMNEFRMARKAGLDSVFRIITNADKLDSRLNLHAEERPAVNMTNEKWLMDSLANAFGIEGEKGQFYILETPFHNDFLPHDVARSRAGIEFARECCKPNPEGKAAIQCITCKVRCMTKVGGKWRDEELSLDNPDIDNMANGGKTRDELLAARGKQIEEFIRRTSLTPEKAEEVRGMFKDDMEDVFGPGLVGRTPKKAVFGQPDQVVPSAPGVKFLKPDVPGAGEPGSDRWTPIAKRYGVKTVSEQALEDAGVEYHGTPDEPSSAAGVLKGQGTLPGFPEREYASMPTPEVVKFAASLEDPKRLPFADEIETPMRFLERVGKGKNNPLKDFIYRAPKAGEDASKESSEILQKELNAKFKELGLKTNYAQSERLGRIMTQRQHLGKGILGEMGLKPVTDPTPAELEAVKWMDERYLQAFHDVNGAREAAGQEPIAWREDYSTFWHVAQNLESDGISLLNAPRETIERALSKAQEEYMRTRTPEQLARERKRSSIFFRFSQQRSGKLGPIDLDQTNVFQRYMSAAFNQMYQAEATAAAKKLIHGQWKVDGKDWKMSKDQPYLYKQLSEYLGFITGGYKGDIPADIYKAGRAMASNAAVSKVGFNARSVVSQLTSNVHTLVNLGRTPQYLLKAVAEDMDGVRQALMGDSSKLKFAQESGDIKWRFKDPIVDEVAKLRGKGTILKARAGAAKVGMAGLQFFDSITADLAWRANFAKAMDGKVEGIVKGDKYMARTYANEEVTRTQSSASKMDLTPLQRKQWGKIATTLQNFVINEWGFVTRDVMGIRNPVMKTPERIGKVVEFYVLCAIVDSLFEDVVGVRSPMNVLGSPSTIARGVIEEKKKGSNTRKVIGRGITEAVGSLPIVGRGLQYGSDMLGVVTDPLTQVEKVGKELTKKNATPADAAGPLIEAAGSALGVPGAMPASRAVETLSRGGTPGQAAGALVGAPVPPAKTAAQKKKETFAESLKRKREEQAKKDAAAKAAGGQK